MGEGRTGMNWASPKRNTQNRADQTVPVLNSLRVSRRLSDRDGISISKKECWRSYLDRQGGLPRVVARRGDSTGFAPKADHNSRGLYATTRPSTNCCATRVSTLNRKRVSRPRRFQLIDWKQSGRTIISTSARRSHAQTWAPSDGPTSCCTSTEFAIGIWN